MLLLVVACASTGCIGITYEMTLTNCCGENASIQVGDGKCPLVQGQTISFPSRELESEEFTVSTPSGRAWHYGRTNLFGQVLNYGQHYRFVTRRGHIELRMALRQNGYIVALPAEREGPAITALRPVLFEKR